MTGGIVLPASTAASAAWESTKAITPAPALWQQRVACSAGLARPRTGTCQHASDHFHPWLQFAAQELRVRAVGDAEAQIHGLQFLVHEEPDSTARFDRRQRRKQRIDSLGRSSRAFLRCAGLLRFLGSSRFESTDVDPALFLPSAEL